MNCPKCGSLIKEGQTNCEVCGAFFETNEKSTDKILYCTYCGSLLSRLDVFCPKCGRRINDLYTRPSNSRHRKISKIQIVATLVVVICGIIGAVLYVGTKTPNFRTLYKTYCKTYWSIIGSDGSYLYIDTNPNDESDNALAYPEAVEAIENINKELNLPESILNDMGQTTFLDGMQTQLFEKQKVSVSWRYHPDKGLEVTYKVLE